MTFRDYARDAADTALSLARVTASSIASAASSLLLDILLAEDDDESGEINPRTASGIWPKAWAIDSLNRAAALPVGAAKWMRSG